MIYYTLCSNMLDNVTAAFSFAFVASCTEKSDVHLTLQYILAGISHACIF